MKVFVAGATGVLGSRAVPLLVAAGHEVTGIARTPEKAAQLRSLGATPISADLFDREALRSAVSGHDVVINLATHIPPLSRAAVPAAWNENTRIRTEGAANLVDAALAAGATRYIQESIAFVYRDGGDAWLDETTPIADSPYSAPVRAAEAAAARFTAAGGTGVVLRFAFFYGRGATHTVAQLRIARRGIAPVTGAADGYQALLHLDDAATAVVAALRAPAGVYNVAEDRPSTRAELAAAVGAAVGRPRLWLLPPALSRLGGSATAALTSSQRVSNRAFREATGWAPAHPDAWSGWAEIAGPVAPTGRGLLAKAGLALLAVQAAVLGAWAAFAPRSFYTDFPGGGSHWVAADGPYNHHLVSDVGGLYLALLVVTVAALGARSRALPRAAGGAWLVTSVIHFAYHVGHRASLGTGDYVASAGGLGLNAVVALVVIATAPAWAAPSASPAPAARPAPALT